MSMNGRAARGALLAVLAVLGGCLLPGAVSARAATPALTVSGHLILRGGQPWTPYGFTLSTFQDGPETWAKNEYSVICAQLRAIAGAWHGNIARFQIEQDEYVYGGDGETAAVFRGKVSAAIAYAERMGLVVVLNDQTEAQGGLYTKNQPLPASTTLVFWKDMERYEHDPDVILDPFNEPRDFNGPSGIANGWPVWVSGGRGYLGYGTLIRDLRADGYTNQIWAEAPGNYALEEMVSTWPKYRLADPRHDLVYSYHHTAVDQATDPTTAEWDAQFGSLVTRDDVPVVDGEWTNRSLPYTVKNKVYEPSGDAGECWGHAPAVVPLYLNYLAAKDIGMTVWTLGNATDTGDPSQDYINADGDNGPFTSANNYVGWTGCIEAKGQPTRGAGADLQAWYALRNP